MRLFVLFLLLVASTSYAHGLTIEDINIDQINKSLPPNWYISNIGHTDAPSGWSKIEGSSGIAITISRTPYSYKLEKTKSRRYLSVYHPGFRICIMPNDFSGKDANGILFKNGEFINPPPDYVSEIAMLILNRMKEVNNHYIFYHDTYFEDWKNPEKIFDMLLIKK